MGYRGADAAGRLEDTRTSSHQGAIACGRTACRKNLLLRHQAMNLSSYFMRCIHDGEGVTVVVSAGLVQLVAFPPISFSIVGSTVWLLLIQKLDW